MADGVRLVDLSSLGDTISYDMVAVVYIETTVPSALVTTRTDPSSLQRLVPADLGGDATHLAVACAHEVDFLLTWNIRHLANPNKRDHLIVVNRRLGLLTPQIVTPEMLWLDARA